TIAIKSSANKGMPWAMLSTALTNLKPTPERATDPTTNPAEAQARQIMGILLAPSWIASITFFGPILCLGSKSDMLQDKTIPAIAPYIGVYPASSIKTSRAMGDIKYSRLRTVFLD